MPEELIRSIIALEILGLAVQEHSGANYIRGKARAAYADWVRYRYGHGDGWNDFWWRELLSAGADLGYDPGPLLASIHPAPVTVWTSGVSVMEPVDGEHLRHVMVDALKDE